MNNLQKGYRCSRGNEEKVWEEVEIENLHHRFERSKV